MRFACRPPRSRKHFAQLLLKEGYIEAFDITDDPARPGRVLTVAMKYSARAQARHLRREAHLEAGLCVYTGFRQRSPVFSVVSVSLRPVH